VELQSAYADIQSRGAVVLAIAVQDTARAQTMQRLVGAEYAILADSEHNVADAFHVYNLLSDGVAAPAVFIIDRRGVIVWSYIGRDANDRPSVAQVLPFLP
jgi:peroxiredoxin